MRILFTGASSFTGYWFVKELVAAGHEVIMTFRREVDQYEEVRRSRVKMLLNLGRAVFSCSFGDARFRQLIEQETEWDLLCHHAADVSDYKSADFDVMAAVGKNTFDLRHTLAVLAKRGCQKVLLTGSVFEGGEGAGSENLPAFSAYGLSKELTAKVFAYYTRVQGMSLGKFVIPNPFGPYEEPRFVSYLIRSWLEDKVPSVNTPAYIRDNIHVSLLAKAYADFAGAWPPVARSRKLNPSGYVESQGSFAIRLAQSMRSRLDRPCQLELKEQTEFNEPRIRINTDPIVGGQFDWEEERAWDELAAYYHSLLDTAREG